MERLYHAIIREHLAVDQQMLFLIGPRQVGKTTISQSILPPAQTQYFNWDVKEHRAQLLVGPMNIAQLAGLDKPKQQRSLVVFDELHKYKDWRTFLKGFYDLYKSDCHIVVTGSAKLDVYNKSGDSLMGRYFPYRVHPLSVRELVNREVPKNIISSPVKINDEDFNALWNFGGYPEPYLKADSGFLTRWIKLRHQQLFEGDIRDLTNIQEIAQLEVLAMQIKNKAGTLLTYSDFSKMIGVSVNTIKRWISTLQSFYYCFTVKPWHKNVVRSLIKEPKIYLWDWTEIADVGARVENFVACHLLKAVHAWNDLGLGNFGLFFIRDKEKREVDFLVTRDDKPWILLEVKASSNHSVSEHLYRFQEQVKAEHVLQVAFDLPYEEIDCFSYSKPVIVPLKTFLSQLV